MDKFKDPQSHYHIPPGTNGPQDEDDHTSSRAPLDPSSRSGDAQSELSTGEIPATSSLPPSTVSGAQFSSARDDGRTYFKQEGYDLRGILEWPVAWGDCDMFQSVPIFFYSYDRGSIANGEPRHVNNVRYIRWIESARIQYAQELDLPDGMVLGMLVSLILRCGAGTGGECLRVRVGREQASY